MNLKNIENAFYYFAETKELVDAITRFSEKENVEPLLATKILYEIVKSDINSQGELYGIASTIKEILKEPMWMKYKNLPGPEDLHQSIILEFFDFKTFEQIPLQDVAKTE